MVKNVECFGFRVKLQGFRINIISYSRLWNCCKKSISHNTSPVLKAIFIAIIVISWNWAKMKKKKNFISRRQGSAIIVLYISKPRLT